MQKWKKTGLVPAGLITLGAAVLLTAVFALLWVPLILRGWLPDGDYSLYAAAAAGLGVFTAVTAAVRLRGRQPMQTAGIVCGGFLLLEALMCALGGESCAFGGWLASTAAAAAAGAFAGAVMSLLKTGRGRRRRGY